MSSNTIPPNFGSFTSELNVPGSKSLHPVTPWDHEARSRGTEKSLLIFRRQPEEYKLINHPGLPISNDSWILLMTRVHNQPPKGAVPLPLVLAKVTKLVTEDPSYHGLCYWTSWMTPDLDWLYVVLENPAPKEKRTIHTRKDFHGSYVSDNRGKWEEKSASACANNTSHAEEMIGISQAPNNLEEPFRSALEAVKNASTHQVPTVLPHSESNQKGRQAFAASEWDTFIKNRRSWLNKRNEQIAGEVAWHNNKITGPYAYLYPRLSESTCSESSKTSDYDEGNHILSTTKYTREQYKALASKFKWLKSDTIGSTDNITGPKESHTNTTIKTTSKETNSSRTPSYEWIQQQNESYTAPRSTSFSCVTDIQDQPKPTATNDMSASKASHANRDNNDSACAMHRSPRDVQFYVVRDEDISELDLNDNTSDRTETEKFWHLVP